MGWYDWMGEWFSADVREVAGSPDPDIYYTAMTKYLWGYEWSKSGTGIENDYPFWGQDPSEAKHYSTELLEINCGNLVINTLKMLNYVNRLRVIPFKAAGLGDILRMEWAGKTYGHAAIIFDIYPALNAVDGKAGWKGTHFGAQDESFDITWLPWACDTSGLDAEHFLTDDNGKPIFRPGGLRKIGRSRYMAARPYRSYRGGPPPGKRPSGTPNPNPPGDPLVLRLRGNAIRTVGHDAEVYFDHDGNGFKELTGWVAPGNGLLMRDKNGNGLLDSGSELFGDFTPLPGGDMASNGFEALGQYDSNDDGRIDGDDPIWSQLAVWQPDGLDIVPVGGG
ncbi:hypothetical protein ACFL2Q_12690 [Thermodesulfobacteriota bacterium]